MVNLLYLPDCAQQIDNGTVALRSGRGTGCEHLPSVIYTPSYHQVKVQLRWLFPLHVYGWSCVFFILALYAFFSFLNIRSQISNRPLMSIVNLFICLLGITRASCLSIDAYNMKMILPNVIKSLLWDTGFISLASGFCFLQLLFLQLTQVKLGFKLLASKTFISLMVVLQFGVMLILDIVTSIHHHLFFMSYISYLVYAAWGIFSFCSFMFVGSRVTDLLRRMPSTGLHITDPRQRGLLQLALLAPYNNLAPFVAAALMPTFLAPSMKSKSSATSAATQSNQSTVSNCPASTSSETENKSTSSTGFPAKTSLSTKTGMPKTILSKESNLGVPSKDQPFKKQLSWKLEEKPSSIKNKAEEATPLQPSKAEEAAPSAVESGKKGLMTVTTDDKKDAVPGFDAVTLDTILNHIAYANTRGSNDGELKTPTRSNTKKQISSILKLTYLVAISGIALSCINVFLILGPYGILRSSVAGDDSSVWPWFIIQTVSRILEVLMASTMANLTKQPVSSRHDPLGYKPREARFSII
ncbi:uncharacterized protein [Bemisia tabaci]|uniref:uncharacterized protein isoform X2 n=1 Tax=Bemisia tabaci TaxID=7038 RepID=UPI003B27FB10